MRNERRTATSTPPDFLTIEEAAAILRIGRTTAYALACRFEATGGAEGLPVRRNGKQLRVPRYALEAMLGGPITWPPPAWNMPAATLTAPVPVRRQAASPRSRSSSRRESTPRLFTA
jgi:hypothetical protein